MKFAWRACYDLYMSKLTDKNIPDPSDLDVPMHEAPRLVTIYVPDEDVGESTFGKFLATVEQTDEIIEIANSKHLMVKIEVLSTREQMMGWMEGL